MPAAFPSVPRRFALLASFASALVGPAARAAVTEAAPHAPDQADVMNALARAGLHDLNDERWNAYGQFTYISSFKLPFDAPYTNYGGSNHSLVPDFEHSFTATATLYLGLALWPGAEVYLVPEVISLKPLSNLTGLGSAIQNFELQKTGSSDPSLYRSRLYFRQTFGFGGERLQKDSDPMQLGAKVDSRRFVFTLGNFSILDFFDKNSYSGDLRRQFFNMAFLSYAAYDFAADARGYTWGAVAEMYDDDWAVRIGRIAAPRDPNQLEIDPRIYKYYGDQIEIEHDHRIAGRDGAVRVLAFRNRENMGRFDDAVAAYQADPNKNAASCTSFNYGSENPTAPDLCWARKTNVKMGIGLNVEQRIGDDVGVFFRGMYSDGQTEVYSFVSADRSIALGALVKGASWHRPTDTLGLGYGQGWISDAHAAYLGRGGIDGFIGDGKIDHAAEHVVEAFYSLNVFDPLWLSADVQRIWNPAYNADRGPVTILGVRAHAEF